MIPDRGSRRRPLHRAFEGLHEPPELTRPCRRPRRGRGSWYTATGTVSAACTDSAGRSSGPRGTAAPRQPARQLRQRRIRRFAAGPFPPPAPGHPVVVHVEAAREAEPPPRTNDETNAGGPVAGLAAGAPQPRAWADGTSRPFSWFAVARGIEARQHRHVRRQGLRHRGIGLPETPAARRQGIERRRLDPLRLGPIASARVVSRVTRRMDGRGGGRRGRRPRGRRGLASRNRPRTTGRRRPWPPSAPAHAATRRVEASRSGGQKETPGQDPQPHAGRSVEPGTASSAAANPTFQRAPSQNGLRVDAPQRHNPNGRFSGTAYSLPFQSTIVTSAVFHQQWTILAAQ